MPEWKDSSIYECAYCGERISSGKYCSNCKTQEGRKKIFEANSAIMKEREEKGLPYLKFLKNWK